MYRVTGIHFSLLQEACRVAGWATLVALGACPLSCHWLGGVTSLPLESLPQAAPLLIHGERGPTPVCGWGWGARGSHHLSNLTPIKGSTQRRELLRHTCWVGCGSHLPEARAGSVLSPSSSSRPSSPWPVPATLSHRPRCFGKGKSCSSDLGCVWFVCVLVTAQGSAQMICQAISSPYFKMEKIKCRKL